MIHGASGMRRPHTAKRKEGSTPSRPTRAHLERVHRQAATPDMRRPLMDPRELANRFDYHQPPDQLTIDAHQQVRSVCREAALSLNAITPESREKSLALTAVQEAMWAANAAIALHGPVEPSFHGFPGDPGGATPPLTRRPTTYEPPAVTAEPTEEELDGTGLPANPHSQNDDRFAHRHDPDHECDAGDELEVELPEGSLADEDFPGGVDPDVTAPERHAFFPLAPRSETCTCSRRKSDPVHLAETPHRSGS